MLCDIFLCPNVLLQQQQTRVKLTAHQLFFVCQQRRQTQPHQGTIPTIDDLIEDWPRLKKKIEKHSQTISIIEILHGHKHKVKKKYFGTHVKL